MVPNSSSRSAAITRKRLRKQGARPRQNENPLAMNTSGDERGGNAAAGDRRYLEGRSGRGDRFYRGEKEARTGGLANRLADGQPVLRAEGLLQRASPAAPRAP